jgi:hypothetical protein
LEEEEEEDICEGRKAYNECWKEVCSAGAKVGWWAAGLINFFICGVI